MSRADQLRTAFAPLAERALLFEYPIREMQRRGWIKTTNDTTEIKAELLRFMECETLAQLFEPAHFAKRFRGCVCCCEPERDP